MKQTASCRIGRLVAVLVATVSLAASAACSSSSTGAEGDRTDSGVLRQLTIGLANHRRLCAGLRCARPRILQRAGDRVDDHPGVRQRLRHAGGNRVRRHSDRRWRRDVHGDRGGRRRSLKLFFGFESSFPYDVYVRSTISSWDDVKGKIVAITSPGSQINAATQLVLANHGIGSNDVQILSIGGDSARMAAMRAGQVDMTLLWEGNKFLAEAANAKLLDSGAASLPFEGGATIASGTSWHGRGDGAARAGTDASQRRNS